MAEGVTTITLLFFFCLGMNWNKWQPVGATVAGGNGRGNQLNQLHGPEGIFISRTNKIFIVDTGNHRIVEWKLNENQGTIVAGGNGQGNRLDQLDRPVDVIVDEQNNSLIIADYGNRRVIRWFLNENHQEILINNILCYGLTMDRYGFIYVCDWEKKEVKRWKIGEEEGTLVAGENGRRNHLSAPSRIFVDNQQSIYVSDWGNNRVMKWKKNEEEGIIVAGGNILNQLSHPMGLIVDGFGQIYVADSGNDRIMRWYKEQKSRGIFLTEFDLVYRVRSERPRVMRSMGEIIVGRNGRGNASNRLDGPVSLSFDREGNLYVVDYCNNRIQRFGLIS